MFQDPFSHQHPLNAEACDGFDAERLADQTGELNLSSAEVTLRQVSIPRGGKSRDHLAPTSTKQFPQGFGPLPAESPRLTRRRWLGQWAFAASISVVPASVLGRGGTLPPSERVQTALVGAGARGQQIAAGGDRVVAVCDLDAKRRARAKASIDAQAGNQACRQCADFRELLAAEDVDGLIVATPDHWHVPIALLAVKAGKAVYVEKPLSLTIAEGRLLADVVRRYGGIVQVGSQQRSDPLFIRACELVRNGRLGKLKRILVEIPTRGGSNELWTPQPVPPGFDYEMWLGPAPWAPYHPRRCHYDFRFVSDYSGGDVTNWGAHHLDIAQWALGADSSGPEEIVGRGKRHTTGLHDVFYDVHVEFHYAGGVIVQLRSGGNGLRFEGTEGWIYVTRGQLQAEPKSLLNSPLRPDELHLALPEGATHMGLWLDAIRQQQPRLINAPVEVGHRSATVCHLANIAMELARPLRWDPSAERFVGDEEANRHLARASREPWVFW